jgi:preprotein translocase subunit SecA
MLSIIKKVFGSKADRDYKEIKPLLALIQETYESVKNLDNDQLRAKTAHFRQLIQSHIQAEQLESESIRKQLEEKYDLEVEEKERLYGRLDELKKFQNEKIEAVLEEILPEAFSVIKETARRFKEKNEVVVTATDFDRNLAAYRPSVEIKGDKAIYQRQWVAGGT